METVIPVTNEKKFAYDIIITDEFNGLGEYLTKIKPNCRVCIVTDDNVDPLYGDEVKAHLNKFYDVVVKFVFPHGEDHKNLDSVTELYQYLIAEHFDRKDLLVALGGGVIGDMTGFAAATYLRGIDFIQVPTTLLSQVDSSIGGKTGVDLLSYKNMVGAFYMPKLVFMNMSVLDTLPEREFASGMGEVIKYGLIQRAGFFKYLSENADRIRQLEFDALCNIVDTSCRCKKEVVEIDPKEHGIRAHLNFGHTIGHAIEKMSGFSLLHGECVGLGMIAACYISMKRGNLSEEEFKGMIELLRKYDLPTECSGISTEDVFLATKSDKKMVGDKVKFILLADIGRAAIDTEVTDEELKAAIEVVIKNA